MRLVVDSNPNLNSISFPKLATIGSLDITNNSNLSNIELPHLSEIRDHLAVLGGIYDRCVSFRMTIIDS